jgi:hypothetical protein
MLLFYALKGDSKKRDLFRESNQAMKQRTDTKKLSKGDNYRESN